MYKIKLFYKLILYLFVTGFAILFFVMKIFYATTAIQNTKKYSVLDVSKVNITPTDIKNINPNPFFEVTGQTPPGTPIIPGQPGTKNKINAVEVLGTIPPDVVILTFGGKTLTAKTGDMTFAGTIGKVYLDGAWINNMFVPLKK